MSNSIKTTGCRPHRMWYRIAIAVCLLLTTGELTLQAQDTLATVPVDSIPQVRDSAVTAAWQAIGRDSTLVDEYLKIIAIHKSRKQFAEELHTAEKMAAANPRSSLAHFTLGDAHLDNSAPELAVPALLHAIEIERTFVRARVTIAEAYAMMHSYDTALLHLDSALLLNPRYAQAHVQRGTLLMQMGQDSAALLSMRSAAELLPDTFGPWMKLARELYKAESYIDAIDAAQYAMSLNPNSPDALYLYAETLVKLERRNEAAQAFERFMLKFPTERRALEAERLARNLQGK